MQTNGGSNGRAGNGSTPIFQTTGKMSTFGGPDDHGMSPNEGLALFEPVDLSNPQYSYLFLSAPPPGTSGLGRRLDPSKLYLACRWDYTQTPRDLLRNNLAAVVNPQNGRSVSARPVDWGPSPDTNRVADLSPGLAAALGLNTDDFVSVTIFRGGPPTVPPAAIGDGHGSSNPRAKPPIKQFIESPNHSSRNGATIQMVVLHCTEASLKATLDEFQNGDPSGRQVSAHYVIDKNGDIYQMVRDSDRANHCRGANQNSIGIEHVAQPKDALVDSQAKSSAALIAWLLEQYDVPATSVYGHDFTPGYNLPGGTTCPDNLFGPEHSQATVAAWVSKNVVTS
jgi:N-acetylmuramoyl-L-alanine amidase